MHLLSGPAVDEMRQAKLTLLTEHECLGFYDDKRAIYPFQVPYQYPVDMEIHVCAGQTPAAFADACYVCSLWSRAGAFARVSFNTSCCFCVDRIHVRVDLYVPVE